MTSLRLGRARGRLADRAMLRSIAMLWSGEIDIAPDWGLFIGSGGSTNEHRHLAHKLVVAIEDGVVVDGGRVLGRGVWFVRSGLLHRCHATGSVALLFLDAGRLSAIEVGATAVREIADAMRTAATPLERFDAVTPLVQGLSRISDPRVTSAASLLLDEPGLSWPELSAKTKLSPGRLTHLFTESIGSAPRQYRTWVTLRRAIELMATGISLTDVAQGAGFADSAHLSRCFSRMLGMPPSAIANSCVIRVHE